MVKDAFEELGGTGDPPRHIDHPAILKAREWHWRGWPWREWAESTLGFHGHLDSKGNLKPLDVPHAQ